MTGVCLKSFFEGVLQKRKSATCSVENVQVSVQDLAIGGPHTTAKTQGKTSFNNSNTQKLFPMGIVGTGQSYCLLDGNRFSTG